jgi:hypothetical protein
VFVQGHAPNPKQHQAGVLDSCISPLDERIKPLLDLSGQSIKEVVLIVFIQQSQQAVQRGSGGTDEFAGR